MIIHILKDGTQVKDITGHVVKVQDATAAYQLLHSVNKAGNGLESKKVSA